MSTYVLAEVTARPSAYDHGVACEKVVRVDARVRAIHHASHRFNMQTVLPDRGIAVDEALILFARLSGRKDRLNLLASY